MVHRLHAVIVLASNLIVGIARAEVIVRVQVLEENNATSTVETLADASGRFLARMSLGHQIIELNGNIKTLDEDRRRVQVSYLDDAQGSTRRVSTNIELPNDQPRVIGKLLGGTGQWSIVLTIVNEK